MSELLEKAKAIRRKQKPISVLPAHDPDLAFAWLTRQAESLRMIALTPKQKRVLDTIRALTAAADGVAPSYEEIAAHLKLVSPSGIWKHVSELERKGWLHRDPARSRSILLYASPIEKTTQQEAPGSIDARRLEVLEGENRDLRAALLNKRGDDLCWVEDPEKAKALPESEFLESCRRYRNQIANDRGELASGRTIAQLEARRLTLLDLLKELEWSGGVDCAECPTCQGWMNGSGHAPGCKLAAELEALR